MWNSDEIVKRGWRVRWVWRRAYDRPGLLARLRYLLTYDRCGVVESAYAWRWHRFGPLFVDVLYTRRELAAKGIELHKSLLYFRDQSEERWQEVHRLRAELFELKRANPSMRTTGADGRVN